MTQQPGGPQGDVPFTPPPWYPPPAWYPPRSRPMNGLAVAALVCAFVLAPLGLIFGLVALSQIRRTGEDGYGLALAGAIVGGVFSLIFLIYLVLVVLVIASLSGALPL